MKLRLLKARNLTLGLLFFSLASLAQSNRKSVPEMLCAHTWKMVKLTDLKPNGGSMGADLFAVTTRFHPDGSIETYSAGHLTRDKWVFHPEDNSLETNQLKDPKSGQIKETIIEITDSKLVVNITYRGNNVMQYEYDAVVE